LLAASLDPSSVAIVDLNGDGRPDLAIANSFFDSDEDGVATVSVRLNRGDGTFKPRRDYSTGDLPESLGVGDVNGDGKPDLVTANAWAGSVSVLLNGGDGSFRARSDYETGSRTESVAIADLNGDGAPDIAAAVADAKVVAVLLNKGDGTFSPPVTYPAGAAPLDVAIGDLDGNGTPDLVTANERSTVSVLLNDGKGHFAPRHDFAAGDEPVSVAIGDLNGDGRADLAVSHFGSVGRANHVSILTNDGGGSFGTRRNYPVADGLGEIAIGDLNGDRKLDVVTTNDDSDRLSVLINRGDGSLYPRVAYPTGPGPQAVAIGDLNRDGRPDLVTVDSVSDQSNDVAVLLDTPGRCNVQYVLKLTPAEAKAKLGRAHCAVGEIGWTHSKNVKKGRVLSQRPVFGAVLRQGGKVNLVVSKGRKH